MFVLMDRKRQLSNVAFGGAWSEQIAGREEIAAALNCVHLGAAEAGRHDPRDRLDVMAALDLLCLRHPKGNLLQAAWLKGARLENPRLRVLELTRIAALLKSQLEAEGRF